MHASATPLSMTPVAPSRWKRWCRWRAELGHVRGGVVYVPRGGRRLVAMRRPAELVAVGRRTAPSSQRGWPSRATGHTDR